MFENEQVLDTQSSDTQSDESTAPETDTQEQAPEKDELVYEKGVKLSEKLQKNPDLEDIVDLGKLPKFKWNGKTLTAKELQSMAMMQSDYTKKTQEIAQSKKYYENLYYDLSNVKQNPELAAKFKSIYPKQFHAYLDHALQEISSQNPVKKEQEATAKPQEEQPKTPALDPRVEEVYNFMKEQRLASAQEKIDALLDRLNSKYPKADEEKIIARVQTLNELSQQDPSRYKRPKDEDIERMFKEDHEGFQKKLKEHLSQTLEEQRKANARGRGPAPGGATAGQAPKLPKTIKEATELALSDPHFQ